MTIRRAFADLPWGQVHYRHGGSGEPALLLHAGPGSARQLEPLARDLVARFRVVAPDMPGNGDSVAMPDEAPLMPDYAVALLQLLDALGLRRVAIYGSHTGAALAAELAILAPGRVTRIVMEGLGVFAPPQRDELLVRYAQPFSPDLDGAYLARAFHFLRDQYLFFPWYERTAKSLRDGAALASAPELHAWLLEVLKAAETYPRAYRAAFAWPARDRLPLVMHPTLLTAAVNDPLHDGTRAVTDLLANGRFESLPRFDDPGYAAARASLLIRFLAN